jgi:hypothetical protein
MARVYKFAQKEYGINSEKVTILGQSDPSFTYNGKQIQTLGTGGSVFATVFQLSAPIAQAVLNGADQLLTWNTNTPNSPGSGISLNGGVITITQPGTYTLNLAVQYNSGYAGGDWGGGICKVVGPSGTLNIPFGAAQASGGIGYNSTTFTLFKTTPATTPATFTFTMNGVGVGGTASGYQIINNTVFVALNKTLFA